MSNRGSDRSTSTVRTSDLVLIVVGLLLIAAGVLRVAVQIPTPAVGLPAPTAFVLQVLFVGVGAILLALGLVRLTQAERAFTALYRWWRARRVPSQPPADIGLPPDRNPRFELRDHELEELDQQIRKNSRVSLNGMGGVGKTQTAVEFLHRHVDRYVDGVFWLRGDTAATLQGDFAALAWLPSLNLRERYEADQVRVIEAITEWLRQRAGWLLVIDNLDANSIDTLGAILGKGLRGHILVTSQVSIWDGGNNFPLRPMDVDTAASFLVNRTGSDDSQSANRVAEMLGGLPLALIQASSYVHETGRDLASYAQLLESRLGELMRRGRPSDHPGSVVATLTVSLERIGIENESAPHLLRLCAFLNADDIPLSLLTSSRQPPSELAAGARDPIVLDSIVGTLRRYSLIDREADSLRVHRLVQGIVRETLSDELNTKWRTASTRLLNEAFPRDVYDRANWSTCARLYPHAREVLKDYPVRGRLIWRLLRAVEGEGIEPTPDTKHPTSSRDEDQLMTRIEAYLVAVLSSELEEVLDTLTPRERRVLQLRYGLIDGRRRTPAETASRFGITVGALNAIEEKGIRKLRHPSRRLKLREGLKRLGPDADQLMQIDQSTEQRPVTDLSEGDDPLGDLRV